jgi:DNA-binding IclR family transcriptional regulator
MTSKTSDTLNGLPGGTLHKGLEILFLMANESRPMTIPDMGSLLGLPDSSLYRIVRTLKDYGLVEKIDHQGHLVLGRKLLVLARSVNEQSLLIKIARPVMKSLAQKTGETILLTILTGDTVICIDSIESESPLRLSSTRGEEMPLHAGASGKCLLAFLPPEKTEKLVSKQKLTRFTPYTITDIAKLEEECKKIRDEGFAYSRSELHEGAIGIAAPILDDAERPVASLTVGGPEERIKRTGEELLIRLVCAAAKQIRENVFFSQVTKSSE